MDFVTQVLVTEILMAGSLVVGYFMGKRGLTGVASDLTNIKTDISNLKGKLDGQAQVVTVAPTPVTLVPV